jgi:hypothetical protein
MEKWTGNVLSELSRQAEEDVIEKYIEFLVADGHGCMRMLYAPQLWAGYPKRAKGQDDKEYTDDVEAWKMGRPIPISWQWCDPLTVFPMWSEAGLEAVLEVDERDVLTLDQRRWNMVKQPGCELQPKSWTLLGASKESPRAGIGPRTPRA